MLNRWISSLRLKRPEFVEQDQDSAAQALLGRMLPFEKVEPVRPPSAQNDPLVGAVLEAVERDLKAAGYLK